MCSPGNIHNLIIIQTTGSFKTIIEFDLEIPKVAKPGTYRVKTEADNWNETVTASPNNFTRTIKVNITKDLEVLPHKPG